MQGTEATTSPLSTLAEHIFTEGAESLKSFTSKPLKINRDLALVKIDVDWGRGGGKGKWVM